MIYSRHAIIDICLQNIPSHLNHFSCTPSPLTKPRQKKDTEHHSDFCSSHPYVNPDKRTFLVKIVERFITVTSVLNRPLGPDCTC